MTAPASGGPGIRGLWVIMHRWSGLTVALFLIVAGATGALLPWQKQLTWLSAPALFAAAPPTPGARPLPGERLAEIVWRRTGGLGRTALDDDGSHAAMLFVAAPPGAKPLPFDVVVVDPYTGTIRATYTYGRLADGPQNIVPFLYALHYSLAAGVWGSFVFGIVALIWTLDCFVAFYLTLPLRQRARNAASGGLAGWLARWQPAWRVRWRSSAYKRNFDLHRAGGLWLWPLLLVFAWSSVGFNLPRVHARVMAGLGAETAFAPPTLSVAPGEPAIGPVAAAATARAQLIARGQRDGFHFEAPVSLYYSPSQGAWRYSARTSLDPGSDDGATTIWISGTDGRLLGFAAPVPGAMAGTIDAWFTLLHLARGFGLAYRIFVSGLGLAVAGLSITGIIIWLKKRRARLHSRRAR